MYEDPGASLVLILAFHTCLWLGGYAAIHWFRLVIGTEGVVQQPLNVLSIWKNVYFLSHIVKITNTGGPGRVIAIPSPRDPVTGAAIELPDSANVLDVQNRLKLALSVGDCGLAPAEEPLPSEVVASTDDNRFGSGFRCQNCSLALPDIAFLVKLLNSICQEMFDIWCETR